jgi:hypothetical protein
MGVVGAVHILTVLCAVLHQPDLCYAKRLYYLRTHNIFLLPIGLLDVHLHHGVWLLLLEDSISGYCLDLP